MNTYLTAKDIAMNTLHYIDGLASVKEAINMMKTHNIEALIIAKRDEKDANGIIVISDIIRGVIILDKNPDEVSVYEIMRKPAISIPSTLNSRYVPRLLVNAKIGVAPVEENGKYVGMISLKNYLFNTYDR